MAPVQTLEKAPEAAPEPERHLDALPIPAGRSWGAIAFDLAGTILIYLAVALVLFAAYLFGWSNLEAARHQHSLLGSYAARGEFAAFHGHAPPDGSMVAVIDIPALGLHQAVVEGTTSTDLEAGPGLVPATALPGSIGDSVIAGRHATYGSAFSHIANLRPGDQIFVTDYEGRYRYLVQSVGSLGGSQRLLIAPTHKALLTLVTSRSSLPPSGLTTVKARLEGRGGKPAAAGPAISASELQLGGGFGGPGPLIGWSLGLIAAAALATVAYRRAGRPLLVYLFSTPVVLVCALFTFENIARLLPATT